MGKMKELKFNLENADITEEEHNGVIKMIEQDKKLLTGLYTKEQENKMMAEILDEERRLAKRKDLYGAIFNLSLLAINFTLLYLMVKIITRGL